MKIVLTLEEVKEALAKAVEEKTQHVLGGVNTDDCYFEIFDGDGNEIDCVTDLVFVWDKG